MLTHTDMHVYIYVCKHTHVSLKVCNSHTRAYRHNTERNIQTINFGYFWVVGL